MRYRGKRDSNHPEIRKALTVAGWSVAETHMVGQGFPDLVAGKHGVTILIEVKTEKGALELSQKRFLRDWKGGACIEVRDAEQAVLECEAIAYAANA